jgi:uncharacterized repeat protein (TIGR01451 family)
MPTADLSVAMDDGKTTVVPGTTDTYTITVTNNGPDTLSSLILSDAIPPPPWRMGSSSSLPQSGHTTWSPTRGAG